MMTAESNKLIHSRVNLRTLVEREHAPGRKLRLLARYAYVETADAERQPCAFRTIGDEVEVSANRRGPFDPLVQADRRMVLDCGAALFRLRIAIQHVGYLPIVRTFPDPLEADRLAVIRLGPKRHPSPAIEAMFERIRRSEGSRTAPAADTTIDLEALKRDARREGTILKVLRMDENGTPEVIGDEDSIAADPELRLVITTSRDLTPDHLNAGQSVERILLGESGRPLRPTKRDSLADDDVARRTELRNLLGGWPQVMIAPVTANR